jgi:uncharacterized protein (DUF433 family)
MNLNDLARVWGVIKPSIEDGDVHEAADVLVNHLIDEGMTAHEIKKAFKDDKKIKEALSYFSDDEDEVWEEDEDDYDDSNEDDWD